jgi:MFS family permease
MLAAATLYLVALRPDPATIGFDGPVATGKPSFGDAFRRPHVKVALAAMVSGQVVMVLIMVATPLHIRHHGFSLGIVGLVMSAHTLGMFAFSPLTGRLADRIGRYRTIMIGLALLGVAAILAAFAPTTSTPVLLLALFLLGLGWNLGFVAGSALLTVGFAPDLRARIQGRADSVTWLSSGVASIASGIVFETSDYRVLALLGLLLLGLPLVVVARHRAVVAATASV